MASKPSGWADDAYLPTSSGIRWRDFVRIKRPVKEEIHLVVGQREDTILPESHKE